MGEREPATADRELAEAALYRTLSDCRVCGGGLVTVLELGPVPLADFVTEARPDDDAPPLDFTRCTSCGLLQLRHTVARDRLYRRYFYRSGINQTMRLALRDVVDRTLSFRTSGTWLDIGANDGTLLGYVPESFRKVACEPSETFFGELTSRYETISDYFSAAAVGDRKFDVISSCAMFYDLDDPERFVTDIATALSPDGVWVNQLSDTDLMLKRNCFDNIVHEHLTYWRLSDLTRLYRRAGLNIAHVQWNEVNGGSIRTFARKGSAGMISAPPLEDEWQFGRRVVRWQSLMRRLLDDRSQTLWAYGASTKGFTLLSWLFDDPAERIEAVADRNPEKHGLEMARLAVPIRSEAQMRLAHPDLLLVLPWAFREEFLEREHDTRAAGTTMIFPLPDPTFVT